MTKKSYFCNINSISKAIGLKPSRTRDHLKELVEEGLLEIDGENKNRKDKVKKG